jgi:hypothetical protein
LVVEGKGKGNDKPLPDENVEKRIVQLLKRGRLTVRDIAQELSLKTGIAYRDLYKKALLVKKTMSFSSGEPRGANPAGRTQVTRGEHG